MTRVPTVPRHSARLSAASMLLLALGGCSKEYTCTITRTVMGVTLPVKQVKVSSRQECARLADSYR